MEKLISKESVLEVAKGFIFTDKTQKRQYMDSLEYCLDNANDNYRPLINADRIRSMSDEELAEFLEKTVRDIGDNMFKCENQSLEKCMDCKECYLKWLKSEVGCE